MVRSTGFACVLSLILASRLDAQTDTVRITFSDAEQAFVRNNLLLLAARGSIDAARGSVRQAALWNNPSIGIEQNVYNRYTGKWFDITRNGNTGIQIQQLLLLAGKRDKKVRMAEIGTEMAEDDLDNVTRALKLELRTSLYDLYFLHQSLSFYDESITTLSNTVTLMENVYRQRAVLLSELLRIKALLFTLQNERLGILARITSAQNSLRILLRDTSSTIHNYVPLFDPAVLEVFRPDSLKLSEVLQIAAENRPDLRKARASVQLEEENLSYQKSLPVPDLTIGGLWSRAGGYIPNYYALTLSVDLPLFDRNQGNIEASERTLEADRSLYENQRATIGEEVRGAYTRAVQTDSLYRSFDRQFPVQYRSLVRGMIDNYQKRYISVIEFSDFIESYRTSVLQMNQLANDRADAIEQLHYATGATFLKL